MARRHGPLRVRRRRAAYPRRGSSPTVMIPTGNPIEPPLSANRRGFPIAGRSRGTTLSGVAL